MIHKIDDIDFDIDNVNNINDIDNINDLIFDKDVNIFYNDEFYIILIFGGWKNE